jgi:hypothetical protein
VDIHTPYEGYPGWALAIGWAIAFVPTLFFVISLIKQWTSPATSPQLLIADDEGKREEREG